MELIALGYLCVAMIFAGLGGYVSAAKGRGTTEGMILGGLFGPLGCLVAACLPAIAPRRSAVRRRDDWTDEVEWRE